MTWNMALDTMNYIQRENKVICIKMIWIPYRVGACGSWWDFLLWFQWKLDCNALPWTWIMSPVSGSNRTKLAPRASSITAGHSAARETGESWTANWVRCHGRGLQSCRKKWKIVLGPLLSPSCPKTKWPPYSYPPVGVLSSQPLSIPPGNALI